MGKLISFSHYISLGGQVPQFLPVIAVSCLLYNNRLFKIIFFQGHCDLEKVIYWMDGAVEASNFAEMYKQK